MKYEIVNLWNLCDRAAEELQRVNDNIITAAENFTNLHSTLQQAIDKAPTRNLRALILRKTFQLQNLMSNIWHVASKYNREISLSDMPRVSVEIDCDNHYSQDSMSESYAIQCTDSDLEWGSESEIDDYDESSEDVSQNVEYNPNITDEVLTILKELENDSTDFDWLKYCLGILIDLHFYILVSNKLINCSNQSQHKFLTLQYFYLFV